MNKLRWRDVVKFLMDNPENIDDVVTVYDRTDGTEYSCELIEWENDENHITLGILIGDIT